MNQVRHKVRNVYKIYWMKSNYKSECMHSLSHESLSYQVCFEPFQQRWDPTHNCPLQISKFSLVFTFNKHCPLKHDRQCVFGSGSKLQQGWALPWLILSLGGQAQLSVMMTMTKKLFVLDIVPVVIRTCLFWFQHIPTHLLLAWLLTHIALSHLLVYPPGSSLL